MATSTQPIGQSLFDFLDGKSNLEKLEALRSGALGREINQYVQSRLDQLHIGSIQDSLQHSIWGSQILNQQPFPTQRTNPVAFRSQSGLHCDGPVDLVGNTFTRVTGPEDLEPGMGGIDNNLSSGEHPTEPIFRSHRDS